MSRRSPGRAARIADHVKPYPNDSVLTLSPLAQSHPRNYGAYSKSVLTVEGQHACKLIGDRWESWDPTSQAIF